MSALLYSFFVGRGRCLQDDEPVRRGGDGKRAQHLPQRAGPALLPGVLLGGTDQEGQGQDQEEEGRKEVVKKDHRPTTVIINIGTLLSRRTASVCHNQGHEFRLSLYGT